MKTPLLAIYLSSALFSSLSAQTPAKPATELDRLKLATKRTVAINNLKQVGLALIEFDTEFGAYPSAETANKVKKASGTKFTLEGTMSNDYFRQLLLNGVKTEKIFQSGNPAKPADDKFATEAEALAAGECEFAYFPGATSSSDPSRPLAVIPLVPGKMEFDPAVFGGTAVVLRNDLSVTIVPINEKGEVIDRGKSLFDPSQPYWQGKKPEVAWPK